MRVCKSSDDFTDPHMWPMKQRKATGGFPLTLKNHQCRNPLQCVCADHWVKVGCHLHVSGCADPPDRWSCRPRAPSDSSPHVMQPARHRARRRRRAQAAKVHHPEPEIETLMT